MSFLVGYLMQYVEINVICYGKSNSNYLKFKQKDGLFYKIVINGIKYT